MAWLKPADSLDKVFEGGIIIKGIDGLLEFIAGLLLFIFSPAQIQQFIAFVTHRELLEDPHDKVANFIVHSTAHLASGGRLFLIIYLWIHAAIKLVAVVGLLRNLRWAYPFSLITLGLLMIYQLYTIFFVKPSAGMVLLTVFDALILWLIWREYKKQQRIVPDSTRTVNN